MLTPWLWRRRYWIAVWGDKINRRPKAPHLAALARRHALEALQADARDDESCPAEVRDAIAEALL